SHAPVDVVVFGEQDVERSGRSPHRLDAPRSAVPPEGGALLFGSGGRLRGIRFGLEELRRIRRTGIETRSRARRMCPGLVGSSALRAIGAAPESQTLGRARSRAERSATIE